MTARRMLAVAMLATALAGCGNSGSTSGVGAASAIPWETDLAAALKRAGAENRLVMVDFYTDWCTWCNVMDEKTFAVARVQDELKRVIPVKLDAERDGRDAARRYRVQGFPTILFLDAQGSEVARIPGFLPAEPFLEELADILDGAA